MVCVIRFACLFFDTLLRRLELLFFKIPHQHSNVTPSSNVFKRLRLSFSKNKYANLMIPNNSRKQYDELRLF